MSLFRNCLKMSAVAAMMCAAASADVFDWVNATDETAVWEVDDNWLGGVYPVNHQDTAECWAMTNSVAYLTNDVPFVQTIQLRTDPSYWNGWKYGTLVGDRYHRIGGRVKGLSRRH